MLSANSQVCPKRKAVSIPETRLEKAELNFNMNKVKH